MVHVDACECEAEHFPFRFRFRFRSRFGLNRRRTFGGWQPRAAGDVRGGFEGGEGGVHDMVMAT